MVLGLTPEAYVVYRAEHANATPEIVSMNGALLFLSSFNAAKEAAEAFIAIFIDNNLTPPKYVWIEGIHRLWVDGEQQ